MTDDFETEMMSMFDTFVDVSLRVVSGAESLVWIMFWRDTDHTFVARSDLADIARRTNLNIRTVRRAVATLEAKGMLQTVRRGRSGPHVYRVRAVGSF